MSELQHPASPARRSNASILIWILPLSALILVLWMAYQAMVAKGQAIEIAFHNGQGLASGKTLLLFRGIPVGKVENARLSDDLSQVIVTVRLDREIEGVAVEGSKFWITRPEISLSGIRGLDTILSGVYLEVAPGNGNPAFQFNGLTEAPILPGTGELPIVLLAKRAHSLKVGSPLYFRDVQVGRINGFSVSGDGELVRIEASVENRYSHFVRRNSRFWNDSGIDVKGSLLGVKIQTDSLETILRGGVAFATPSFDEAGDPVEQHTPFTLYEEPEKKWLEWGGAWPSESDLMGNSD